MSSLTFLCFGEAQYLITLNLLQRRLFFFLIFCFFLLFQFVNLFVDFVCEKKIIFENVVDMGGARKPDSAYSYVNIESTI